MTHNDSRVHRKTKSWHVECVASSSSSSAAAAAATRHVAIHAAHDTRHGVGIYHVEIVLRISASPSSSIFVSGLILFQSVVRAKKACPNRPMRICGRGFNKYGARESRAPWKARNWNSLAIVIGSCGFIGGGWSSSHHGSLVTGIIVARIAVVAVPSTSHISTSLL